MSHSTADFEGTTTTSAYLVYISCGFCQHRPSLEEDANCCCLSAHTDNRAAEDIKVANVFQNTAADDSVLRRDDAVHLAAFRPPS